MRRVCAGVAIPNEEFWVSWVSGCEFEMVGDKIRF